MPIYNEQDALLENFERLRGYLEANEYDVEFILVDDASTDKSFEIAQGLARRYEHVKVVHHARNQGPCSGLKSGPQHATRDWLLLMPVDICIPLTDIETLWNSREGLDIVVGYIDAHRSRSWRRSLQSTVYSRVIRMLFGLSVKQVNYVSLYRTELLKRLPLTTSGVALHAEILIRAHLSGAALGEVGLGYVRRNQGVASGGKPAVVAKTVKEILRLRRQLL